MIRIVTGGETISRIDKADDRGTDTETRARADEFGDGIEIPVYSEKTELPARPENWGRRDSNEGDEEHTSQEPTADGGTTPEDVHAELETPEMTSERATSITVADRDPENESGPGSGSQEKPKRLSCWLCRQPLAHEDHVRWRGEPVHPGCLRT